MKRQHVPPSSEETLSVKKAKTVGTGITMPGDSATNTTNENEDGGEWTKVEKKKKAGSGSGAGSREVLSPASPTPADGPASAASKKAEKRRQKKARKIEAALQPRFMYNNAEIIKRNHPIGIEEIRDLIIHILADAPPPNWLRVDNAHMIDRVVAILVPGLTPPILSLPTSTSPNVNPSIPISIPLLPRTPEAGPAPNVPFIAATFSHACPTRAPGDATRMHSVLSAFFQLPISGEEKKKRIAKRLASESNHDPKDPRQYLLTLEQMVENDYPVPSYMADVFEKSEGWVETPKPDTDPEGKGKEGELRPRVYAIDCEMCLTEDGKELARVSMIDFHSGDVVYDRLVKPAKPIVDYLTRWSGITPQALASVTTTLAEVQQQIMAFLSPSPPPANPFRTDSTSAAPPPPTPILLGHSLESDLRALKICHPYCIDTALLFHHPRGRPLKPGLAWLTKKWCGREIQTRGEGGHDPEEDARACVELVKRKMENGPGWGEFKMDLESIFERMGRSTKRGFGSGGGGGEMGGSIRTAVVDYGNPSAMHGSKATSVVPATTDDEVVEGIKNTVQSHHFVFGRLMRLADLSGWTTPKQNQDSVTPAPAPAISDPDPEELKTTLDNLNTHLKAIHASLPPKTAFIIFTGHSDPRKMSALNQRKSAFENLLKAGMSPEQILASGKDIRWTAQDMRELEGEVEIAKRGLVFLGVKQS